MFYISSTRSAEVA